MARFTDPFSLKPGRVFPIPWGVNPSRNGENSVSSGFLTTHWTAVSQCGAGDELAAAARAVLCASYWKPVFEFLQREGYSRHDSEDLAQGFFEFILQRPWFERADQARGRFRNFLLTSVKRFASNVRFNQIAQRRGGGIDHVSLDLVKGCAEESSLLTEEDTHAFDAAWATALLEAAVRRLEEEYLTAAKGSIFARLSPFLTTVSGNEAYARLAAETGMSAGAVKIEVQRLRKRFGSIVRDEVAKTVSTAAEINDELRIVQEAHAAVIGRS